MGTFSWQTAQDAVPRESASDDDRTHVLLIASHQTSAFPKWLEMEAEMLEREARNETTFGIPVEDVIHGNSLTQMRQQSLTINNQRLSQGDGLG